MLEHTIVVLECVFLGIVREDPSGAEEGLDGGWVAGGGGPVGVVAEGLVDEAEFLGAGGAVESGGLGFSVRASWARGWMGRDYGRTNLNLL